MRKFANRLIAFLFFMVPLLANAQTSITGRVVNEKDGTGIDGATVLVKGSKTGTKTDANGNFTIAAKKGDVLVVSSVNFREQQIKVKDAGIFLIRLVNTDGTLGEVVITAMDIRRNSREVGYSVQKVGGQDIVESQRDNFLNSLQGRVAGATITPTGGQAGASSNIVLRGFNSLALSNQPLFVLDGIIVDNQTLDQNSNTRTGIGLASDLPNRNDDYTNRIADINPNDIESITVLKGPEATALYGSQASAGAIVITTKKLRANTSKKISVNYDNSFRFQKLSRIPEYQNLYSPGSNGNPAGTPSFIYYGPKYPAGTQFVDNIHNFFQTGFSNTHNLNAEWGNKNLVIRFSSTYLKNKGVVPTNSYEKINLRLSGYYKPNKYFDISPSISWINSTNEKPLRGSGGYLLTLLSWPNNVDIKDYLDANGNKKTVYTQSDPINEIDNPWFNVKYNRSHDVVDRKIATLGVNIFPFKWLTLSGRFGYDTYKNDGWIFNHPQSNYTTTSQRGSLDNYYRVYKGYNHTINLTAKKSFKKFEGRVMIGNMWQDYRTDVTGIVGNKIIDVARRDSSNTDPNTRLRLSRQALYGKPNYSLYRQVAYFGEVAVSYNNVIFISGTYRMEESSTLPKINRRYSYPGGSISLIFSDMIPALKKSNFLTYGKIRGSLAGTAKINSPYSNQSIFALDASSGGGYSYGFTNNNFGLTPEKQKTYEIGADLRFLKNLITIDAAYYNTKNTDQILELVRSSYATGYILNTLNAASTRNQGVEVSLGIIPVRKKNINWSMNFNFAKNWNKVLKLPGNIPEFYISDTWLYQNARGGLKAGGPTTSITSWGYVRNNAGQILIDPASGLPINDQKFTVHGDRNPDFNLGFNNSLRYKSWKLNMLWNFKVGGDIFNATEYYEVLNGKSVRTADRELARVFDGVLKDGLENTANPTKNTISIIPYFRNDYYNSGLREESFIEHNINWARLSELSLSYTFSTAKLKRMHCVKNLSAFVTGNDLIMWTNYSGADPAVNGNTPATHGVGAFGFDFGNIATPRSVSFGIKASF